MPVPMKKPLIKTAELRMIGPVENMENNKRPIGKKNAVKFARALNMDYRVFL